MTLTNTWLNITVGSMPAIMGIALLITGTIRRHKEEKAKRRARSIKARGAADAGDASTAQPATRA